eukprot:Em0013g835a
MDKCINEIQTIHECADRIIVIKEASRLRSLGCTGNSDSAGDGGHGGSNEVMDTSTGNSDNTTDGQHGGRIGVMDAPLLRSFGCTGNSDSTGDGGHGGSNEVMDASTGNSDNTTDGQHGGSNGVMDAPLLRSFGCTGNSDSTGDGGHGGSNEVMDASTGNSDNTTDGQHGGSNGVMDAPLLRSLCCTENSDSAGDGGHSGSNEIMDASTGNSDNTTDGQHGGSNGVIDAPLLRSLGCTGNSDSAGDGGHGGGNEVMDAPLLKSLGDGYSTSDGHHTDDGHSQGSRHQKHLLSISHPSYYEEFKTICELQSRHKIKDLPNQYLFAVVCCLKQDCIHPMCRSGAYQLPIWYNGGPSIRYLPLPIPDPERPYGGNCSECKNGECYGHFMKPDRAINATVAPMCKPPSAILKEIFDKYSGNPFHGNIIQEAAKQVLLPPCEVEMWFKHLVTVAEMRKKGSKKAAETRQKNKKAAAEIHKGTNEAETFCGASGSIAFISKAWGGRVSDKALTQKCGFLDLSQMGMFYSPIVDSILLMMSLLSEELGLKCQHLPKTFNSTIATQRSTLGLAKFRFLKFHFAYLVAIALAYRTVMTEVITLGGGCFWCLEAVFVRVKGVTDVESGYSNGHVVKPSYRQVCSGNTGHAEVVKVTFKTSEITLKEILDIFFVIHDPTTPNCQGNDVGTQYRSGIYYHTPEQKTVAEAVIAELTQSKQFSGPIVTEVLPVSSYSAAEDYHQDYYANNPGQGYCKAVVGPKVAKFRKHFASKLNE